MPNRYLPRALAEMIGEVHDSITDHEGKGDDGEYVPEHEALVTMLKPKYRDEYRERRGEGN